MCAGAFGILQGETCLAFLVAQLSSGSVRGRALLPTRVSIRKGLNTALEQSNMVMNYNYLDGSIRTF